MRAQKAIKALRPHIEKASQNHTTFFFAKNHVLLDTIHTVQISYSINKLPLWIHDASITKKQTVILRKYNKPGTCWVEVGAKGSGVE